VVVRASSSVYETDPVGEILDQPPFYNACLQIQTGLEPLELLRRAKAVERALGRDSTGPRHGPRPIDVDLLMLGALVQVDGPLELPHPALTQRRFVLIGLLELEPSLRLPSGRSVAEALLSLPVDGGVRHAGAPLRVGQAGAGTQAPGSTPLGVLPASGGK
jgi:2-amino-4-hydroxy-6-hydroxymethyldihydropteridine diphosphokinase